MIKKMITKKILIASLAMISLSLFCLFKDKNEIKIKEEISYVDKIMMHEIYLIDSNNYLALTKIPITSDDPVSLATELLDTLIKEGKGESKIPSGFRSIIPSSTIINNILFDNNIIKVDFSKDLFDVPDNLEEQVLESIIFTLTSIEKIEKVLIYIDGEILTSLPKSGKLLPSIFDRTYGINKRYNINDIHDITRITIYYINKYNEDYYYVPVTTYLNDDRDKIEIIIDELSNNFLYTENLMSFLSNDIKLLSYKNEDSIMTLSFNDAIFDSLDDNTILEEVAYTISLSVMDNYDVDNVMFMYENEYIFNFK